MAGNNFGQIPANDQFLRGIVNADGTIAAGTGFTVNKTGTGAYTVTFSVTFTALPVFVATPLVSGAEAYLQLVTLTTTAATVQTRTNAGGAADRVFHFHAITPS